VVGPALALLYMLATGLERYVAVLQMKVGRALGLGSAIVGHDWQYV